MSHTTQTIVAYRRDAATHIRVRVSSMVASFVALRKRVGESFWRLADKKIPNEWLVCILGGSALLAYLLVLFFGTRPRK